MGIKNLFNRLILHIKMNVQYLNGFIEQIEYLSITSHIDDEVKDNFGSYKKIEFLKSLVFECKELMRVCEYKIALENILENLNEVSILLDSKIIDLARKAFGDQKTDYHDELLRVLCK
jgi:hypothetical protein